MIKSKTLAGLLSLVVLALSAAPALAADSSVSGYNSGNKIAGLQQSGGGGGGGDKSRTGGKTASASSPSASQRSDTGGKLPFTGADLSVLVATGGILLLVGFGLRRMTHGPEHA